MCSAAFEHSVNELPLAGDAIWPHHTSYNPTIFVLTFHVQHPGNVKGSSRGFIELKVQRKKLCGQNWKNRVSNL